MAKDLIKIWIAFSFELWRKCKRRTAKKKCDNETANVLLQICWRFKRRMNSELSTISKLCCMLQLFCYNFCKSQMEISLSPPSTFAIRSMVRAAYPETLNFWQALVNFLLCRVGFDFPPERVPDAWSESIKLWRGFEFNENLLCWMSFLSFLTSKDRELLSLLAVDMLKRAIWSMFPILK